MKCKIKNQQPEKTPLHLHELKEGDVFVYADRKTRPRILGRTDEGYLHSTSLLTGEMQFETEDPDRGEEVEVHRLEYKPIEFEIIPNP